MNTDASSSTKAVTAWVKPAPAIKGQDHLGTQAPCEAIYVKQLSGITTATRGDLCSRDSSDLSICRG